VTNRDDAHPFNKWHQGKELAGAIDCVEIPKEAGLVHFALKWEHSRCILLELVVTAFMFGINGRIVEQLKNRGTQ